MHLISWHPDRSESTRGTSLSQRDSKLPNEIQASGQLVQHGAQNPEIAQHPERSDTNSMRSITGQQNPSKRGFYWR